MAFVVVGRAYIQRFEPPDKNLDSYHYLKSSNGWLKGRFARSRRIQRHFYAPIFLAVMLGLGASTGGQALIRALVEQNPGLRLVSGVPLVVLVSVAVAAIAIELLGGAIFDFDVHIAYRSVFRKLDEMIADMEELRR